MSIAVQSKVWADSKLSGTALLLLLAIADFADDNGVAFPSVPTLAKKIRSTPRNVNLLLVQLRDAKELEIQQAKGPRGTNLYRVKTPSGMKKPSGVKGSSGLKNSSGVKGSTGEESFSLKNSSQTPEEAFRAPLKNSSDKPSREPSGTTSKPRERGLRQKKPTPVPSELPITDEISRWAEEHRFTESELKYERDKMLDHYRARGEERADWYATLRTWLRKCREFQKGRQSGNGNGNNNSHSPAEIKDQRRLETTRRAVDSVVNKLAADVSHRTR